MYQELFNKIQRATCSITVFDENEKISAGTGFCFLPTGEVLTAGHVVTSRLPLRHEDVIDPNIKIFAKFQNIPVMQYKVALCGITIQNESFSKPVQIDIALLVPINKPTLSVPTLVASTTPPQLGEELFLAGFSDEIELPFMLESLIEKETPGYKEFLDAMEKGYNADMMSLMIKRGVVGNNKRAIFESTKINTKIECDIFYLDNGMHSGASGGPIVNINGDAVGIITERAITNVPYEETPNLRVPSGSTMGISLQPILIVSK